MKRSVKFSSKIDEEVLQELRSYAQESQKNISLVLNEAVAEYLAKVRLRQTFINASAEVVEQHAELLKKLAE